MRYHLEDYNRPEFWWDSVRGAVSYLLQIDTSSEFDSANLINETLTNRSFVPENTLSNGTWYWRVAGIDYQGDLGRFSETRSEDIGTTALTDTTTTDPLPEIPDTTLLAIIFVTCIIAVVIAINAKRTRSGKTT